MTEIMHLKTVSRLFDSENEELVNVEPENDNDDEDFGDADDLFDDAEEVLDDEE